MSGHCDKIVLLRVVWAIVGSYQSVSVGKKEYLFKSSREMYYVDRCGFHGILMLHCPIICCFLFTFNGRADRGICWKSELNSVE
jgi:hypothetical protein